MAARGTTPGKKMFGTVPCQVVIHYFRSQFPSSFVGTSLPHALCDFPTTHTECIAAVIRVKGRTAYTVTDQASRTAVRGLPSARRRNATLSSADYTRIRVSLARSVTTCPVRPAFASSDPQVLATSHWSRSMGMALQWASSVTSVHVPAARLC